MWSGIVIVVEVVRKDAVQMSFVEHDQVIQAVSAYAADDAFAIRVCQGDRGAIRTSSIPISWIRFLK